MNRFVMMMALALVSSSCGTRKNPEFCTSSADCADPTKPFCDVNGDFGDLRDDCIATPIDGGLDASRCTPGAALACSADTLTTCATTGVTTTEVPCPLGCATTGAIRCLSFEPSNGLGAALAGATGQPDVVFPQNATLDTDLGIVTAPDGTKVAVKSIVVQQLDGLPSIRAFQAGSFVMDNVLIVGTNSLAFVAPGAITVRGKLDASATAAKGGPGSQEFTAVCIGVDAAARTCGFGAGGGGNATMGGGGTGATGPTLGGSMIPGFEPLVGGCRGGNIVGGSSTVVSNGGGGGGGVELVSLTSVSISGLIDLGGGGGASGAGGGSAGTLIIEAPRISLVAPGGFVANGGAGGGCGGAGSDGPSTSVVATNAGCAAAGKGGTSSTPPTTSAQCSQTTGCSCALNDPPEPGGGGAAGRARIVTLDGQFQTSGAPIVDAVITRAQLTIE